MSRSPNDSYLGLASIRGNTGELTGVSEEVEGATVRFRRGDVLFARLRPYLNKVHVAETDGTCSPEFYVLRVRANRAILPEYLAIILRSRWVLAQTVHMMTGNTHPRLADEDVAALRLPVPDVSVQSAMANEAAQRRATARRLRAEAEEGWREARAWFEAELLGAPA